MVTQRDMRGEHRRGDHLGRAAVERAGVRRLGGHGVAVWAMIGLDIGIGESCCRVLT
jgi:hypothetical protein